MKRVFKTQMWLLIFLVVGGCSLPSQPARQTPTSAGVASPMPGLAAPINGSTPQLESSTQTAASDLQLNPAGAPDITALPGLADLQPGWNQMDPGGATTCARGGKYSFFVRKTTSDKLLIYFEGGGSCYDAETCRKGANKFDDSIDPAFPADNPSLKTDGVFALNDPRNPFKDYNVVFVSYCTGDGYLGHQTATYHKGLRSFTVQHQGFTNTQVVLDWTYRNFAQPAKLFMMGCSAGVIGGYFHVPFILEHYRNVPTVMVGDSGGGYVPGPTAFLDNYGTRDLLPNWLPQYQQLVSGTVLDPSLFFSIPVNAYPGVRFALLDTQQDAPQSELISRFNPQLTLADVLRANLKTIQAAAPDVLYYEGSGDYHCISMVPAYYEYEVRGIKLNDWITRLAAGQPVESVAP